ncbi:MAG TPA: DivIVA domain-containing protein [Actinomycetota bacterium]|nr:DivIVA domain-containing protein [Actinomycetota bacterium]
MRKRRRERAELESGMMAAPAEPRRITPMDIQQKEFRLSFRGYNEREVDEFLDALTEELARLQSENVRLRAELENREQEARAAQAEAEATLRRAREEAARMLQEAEAQAQSVREVTEGSPAMAEGAPSVGSFLKKNSMVQAIRPFLGREREFLQSMARLIQEHADSVREEVRQIREEPSPLQEDTVAPVDPDRTALPGETAPRIAGSQPNTTGEREISRRSGKRPAEREPVRPERIASRERAKAPDRRGGSDAEDGRRAKDQGPASPPAASTAPERRSGGPLWGDAPSEGAPADLFKPKRRVARPPVSRLEEDQPGRSFEEGLPQRDLPATQPFEPFRFDERSGDQPLERGDGDEDERSLRELFWGEE